MTADRDARAGVSTYRLQITADFDLFEAARRLPYLHDLGVDWVYLSPLLAAEPGSTHGYDVVDYDRVDASRGGAEGLAALSAEARRLGMGVLVDIVPNHVGVATPARQRVVVGRARARPGLRARRGLRHRLGRRRRQAAASRSLGDDDLPVDGGPIGHLAVVDGELRYHDHRVPARSRHRRHGDGPDEVHARQHYELVSWRRGRRRPELPPVLRRQHPGRRPGRGPRGVRRAPTSRSAAGSTRAWSTACGSTTPTACATPRATSTTSPSSPAAPTCWSRRSSSPARSCPAAWATAGTTGYDALALLDRVLTDPARRAAARRASRRGCAAARSTGPQLVHDTQARGRRRHPALRGPPHRARAARCLLPRRRPTDARGRGRRAAGLLPGLPLLPARRAASTSTRPRAGPRAPPRPGRRPRRARARCWPTRRQPRRAAVPADQRDGDGQGRRGLRVLPLLAAHLAQRGRRRPARLLGHARRVARRDGRPAARLAARDDRALDPRHQARRGRPRADHRCSPRSRTLGAGARRACSTWRRCPTPASATCCGRRSSAPGRRPARRDWRERLHAYAEKAMREAGDRTTWTEPDEDYEAAVHAAVDAAIDRRRGARRRSTRSGRRSPTPAGATRSPPSWSRSRCPACPTSTRAASCGSRAWSTRTTAGPVDFDVRRALLDAVAHGERPSLTPADRRRRRGQAAASPAPACRCAASGPSCSPPTRRWPRPARPPTTCSPSTAAARHRRHPAARSASPPAAAGATRRSPCRPGEWTDAAHRAACSTGRRARCADLLGRPARRAAGPRAPRRWT